MRNQYHSLQYLHSTHDNMVQNRACDCTDDQPLHISIQGGTIRSHDNSSFVLDYSLQSSGRQFLFRLDKGWCCLDPDVLAPWEDIGYQRERSSRHILEKFGKFNGFTKRKLLIMIYCIGHNTYRGLRKYKHVWDIPSNLIILCSIFIIYKQDGK